MTASRLASSPRPPKDPDDLAAEECLGLQIFGDFFAIAKGGVETIVRKFHDFVKPIEVWTKVVKSFQVTIRTIRTIRAWSAVP